MAAPTLKNFSQAVLSDAGTATSPSDTSIGDLVVCIVWSQFTTTATTHTANSGFTIVRTHSHNDSTTCGRLTVATKVATAAGATAYTPFTIASATAGQTCAAIVTVTGADTSNPANWISNSVTDTSSAVPNPPSVANLNYDNLVLAIAAWSVTTAGATSATVMANYTLNVNGPTGTHVTHLAVAYRAMTGQNLVTEDPAAYGDNVTPNGSASMTIAIPMAPVAQTYYVAAAGNDSNNGITTGTAWKTINQVNSHVFLPGDTVRFNGGETFTGGLYIHDVASGSANPVTLESYGTGKATISTAAGTDGCYFYRMGGFVVQNLNFTGPGAATANKDGISVYTDAAATTHPYVRVTNCTVSGYYSGMMLGGSGTSGYSDVRVTGCTFNANKRDGFLTWGGSTSNNSSVYVGNCVASGNVGIASFGGPSGSGITFGSVNGGTIEFCTAYGNGANNTDAAGPIGIWAYKSNNVTIQNCESYNNLSNGGDGGGFDLDGGCTGCIIQYCYSHGNKGAGFALFQYAGATSFSGNVIRYCISENDQEAGIAFWGASGSDLITNSSVYNCTVYNSVAPVCKVLNSNLTGITVKNCIFLSSGGVALVDHASTTGITFANNNYYPVSGAFLIWWGGTAYSSRTAWGQDTSGFQVDPQLAGVGSGGTIYPAALTTMTAYKISAYASPMRGAGATITSPGSTDFWGDALFFETTPDVGADESTLTAPPPVTHVFPPLSPFVIA